MEIEKLYSVGYDNPGWGIRLMDKSILTGFKTEQQAKHYLIKNRERLIKRFTKKPIDKAYQDMLRYQFIETLEGAMDGMLDHYREWKKAMDDYGFLLHGGSVEALARFKRLPLRHKEDFDRACEVALQECPKYIAKEKA